MSVNVIVTCDPSFFLFVFFIIFFLSHLNAFKEVMHVHVKLCCPSAKNTTKTLKSNIKTKQNKKNVNSIKSHYSETL